MLLAKRKLKIETERMTLRPPTHSDFRAWTGLRRESEDFLTRWEPSWAQDHLSRKGFTNRVYWAQRSVNNGSAVPSLKQNLSLTSFTSLLCDTEPAAAMTIEPLR